MLHLIGGGGHASVVADAARRCGERQLCIWADEPSVPERFPAGTRFRPLAELDAALPVLLAVGDLSLRRRLRSLFPCAAEALIHPAAVVGGGATIDSGTVVLAGSVINPNARIAFDVIVNTAAVVEHDCVIGRNSHLSPGVRLAGGVTIGEDVHVGTGAIVLPGLRIGDGAVVGAGAVVLRDVDAGNTVAGVPAREIQR